MSIYKRKLKNVVFQYDADTKMFTINKTNNPSIDVTELNKSEACAFSRFVFSMVQYKSRVYVRQKK